MTGLRKIDVSPRVRCEPKRDFPEIGYVRIDRLRIDDAYQRPIVRGHGWRHIEKIAEKFDWNLFVPIVVARLPDNLFALIDGQHRAHAAYLAGFDEVPCIIRDMASKEQAAAFVAINSNVTRMSGFNVYKAALAAGEEWAVEADRVVAAAGCQLMRGNRSAAQKKAREVYAVALVKRMVARGAGRVVTDCLSGLANSSVGDYPQSYAGAVLHGYFEVVAEADGGPFDLAAFCGSVDPSTLYEKAAGTARFGGETARAIYKRNLAALLPNFVSHGDEPHEQCHHSAPEASASICSRLTDRQTAELIRCQKLSEVSDFAERHGMTIRQAQSYWHRLRAA